MGLYAVEDVLKLKCLLVLPIRHDANSNQPCISYIFPESSTMRTQLSHKKVEDDTSPEPLHPKFQSRFHILE